MLYTSTTKNFTTTDLIQQNEFTPNREWELSLDIDDLDLGLSPFIRPYNSHHNVETTTTTETIVSLHNPNVDNCDENTVRIILGPEGIVQAAKLRKIADMREGGEEFVMSTHKYIRKVVMDMGEDEDFTRGPWLSTIEFVNVNGGIMSGCLGNIKNFLKNGKLDRVIAIIKSCSSNALGNLTVTLKDLSGTLSGTIHHKVLAEGGYGKDITLGTALILYNVSMFILNHKSIILILQGETWLRFSIRIQLMEMVVV
ncbi:hypothetical protein Tco_1522442 [Tanacetum coccineum]